MDSENCGFCRHCAEGNYDECETFAFNSKDAEIERLNALVAMQTEAITEYFDVYANADKKPHWCNRVFESRSKIETALSATKETVSAWQSNRDNEIGAKVLEDAADYIGDVYSDTCPSYSISKELRKLAAKLRTKGE